jgi:predicted neutral ceramidase superfamily lipid hydrolase
MKKDDLSGLSQLWQSAPEKPVIALDKLKSRHKKQFWIMLFNVIAETMLVIAVGYLFITELRSGAALMQSLWLGFAVIWSGLTYLLINRSRLQSFRLLRSKSLTESMPEHINLIKQEILRWHLSWIATGIFTLVLMLFVAAGYLSMGHITTDIPRLLLALLILVLALVFFRHKKQRAKEILNRLTE